MFGNVKAIRSDSVLEVKFPYLTVIALFMGVGIKLRLCFIIKTGRLIVHRLRYQHTSASQLAPPVETAL